VHLRLLEPPEVSALSSTSFAISWADHALASDCRPDVTYAVQMRRAHPSRTFAVQTEGEDAEWVTVKASVSRPTVELSEGKCPEGCAFRYRPNSISGWTLWSTPSPNGNARCRSRHAGVGTATMPCQCGALPRS